MSIPFDPITVIEEVKKYPGLYDNEHMADREERLVLWKKIGAAIYEDWDTLNKATAYDRVLQLQKKWRSLRDAYNRELRARKTGMRINKRVYMYFKPMSFLGGFEGTLSAEEEDSHIYPTVLQTADNEEDPLVGNRLKKIRRKIRAKKRTIERYSSDSNNQPEEVEMPLFNMEMSSEAEADSDKLFLLSFLPEMRQLPVSVKMWARAQIANVMQEAVTCQYNNAMPTTKDKNELDIKRQRRESSE